MQNGVVLVHVGQAGIQLGAMCWEQFAVEHNVQADGYLAVADGGGGGGKSDATDSYKSLFDESICGRLIPRTIFADSEPCAIDNLQTAEYRQLFRCNRMVSSAHGSGGIYGRAYNVAEELLNDVENKLRIVTEACHSSPEFVLFHSIGGGTGSAFPGPILKMTHEQFPKASVVEFVVCPSDRLSTIVVEPYNAIMGAHSTLDFCNCSFVLDNESISNIYSRNDFFGEYVDDCNYLAYLNKPIVKVVSSVTSDLRFGGAINYKLKEFERNLVPFPRVHFVTTAYSPLISNDCRRRQQQQPPIRQEDDDDDDGNAEDDIEKITNDCFDVSNQLIKCEPRRGVHMACCFMYRGGGSSALPVGRIRNAIITQRSQLKFVDWCPSSCKIGTDNRSGASSLCTNQPVKTALCLLSNNTAVAEPWARTAFKFDLMFAKRAYLHWYESEGIEDEDMMEARDDIADLLQDYQLCQ